MSTIDGGYYGDGAALRRGHAGRISTAPAPVPAHPCLIQPVRLLARKAGAPGRHEIELAGDLAGILLLAEAEARPRTGRGPVSAGSRKRRLRRRGCRNSCLCIRGVLSWRSKRMWGSSRN